MSRTGPLGAPFGMSDATERRLADRLTGVADLLGLAAVLRAAPSGLSFIYRSLDVLAERYALSDAVMVIEETPVGRQAFRFRRGVEAAPDSRRWLDEVLRAPAGLHTDPDVVDPTAAAYVAELATIALTVDLLSHDASHDALTGLLNRRSYEEALADAVARNRRYGWPFALVMIDLDNFKVINDRHGHAAGDDALRSLGVELRAILRTGDVAARLGGDEFALIILNAESPETLEPLTERLRSALDRGVAGAKLDFSAGVACFPTDSEDIVHLQRLADQRLYADKGSRG